MPANTQVEAGKKAFLDVHVAGHFLTGRAKWEYSRHTSITWALTFDSSIGRPACLIPEAIAWLPWKVLAGQDGPINGERITATICIQRLNTSGGAAPAVTRQQMSAPHR
jgi:hypothetical protein